MELTFVTTSLCQKDCPWSGNIISGKEKVTGETVSKEGYADILLGHERTHHKWFLWKRSNCKQYFLLPSPLVKFTLFIEWLLYILIKTLGYKTTKFKNVVSWQIGFDVVEMQDPQPLVLNLELFLLQERLLD